VQESLPDPPSYSAVRAMLRLLDEKGYLKHEQDGPRYLFKPTLAREKARKSAMKQMLETFFDGSTEQAVAALLNLSKSKLGKEELDRMSQMIETAKKEGR
jgi:predicted transcriptional regulator